MDQLDFKILLSLKEEQNLSKVAQKLYLSQPSLTYRIRKIEKNIGVPLFIRTKRGLIPNTKCDYFVDKIEKIDDMLSLAIDQVKHLGDDASGKINIGSANSFSCYRLPQVLKEFNTNYPNITVDIKSFVSEDIYKLMRSGKISVSIIRGNKPLGFDYKLIDSEPLCIVSKKKLTMEDLKSTPYIKYQTSYDLRKAMDNWWNEHFTEEPNQVFTCNSLYATLELIKNGLGWSILPSLSLDTFDGYTKEIYFKSNEKLTRETYICWNSSSMIPLDKYFLDFLLDYYNINKN